MNLLFIFLLALTPHWTLANSGVSARLRGISAINERVAWASGAGSTVLRTGDGGVTWTRLLVTNEALDFRDIDAIDSQTAFVLSIGNGSASRIYKTEDGGASWTMQFRNEDPKAFLDAMSFWDAEHGIVIGDSIDRQFYILMTLNGGRSWSRVPPESLPPALENEGAFAASGTNIAIFGKDEAWIATGAGARARVLRTMDRGKTWKVFETPIKSGGPEGIFSIAFRDREHGVIVGGDYTKEKEALDNLAITSDGGQTWTAIRGLTGFRSVAAFVPGTRICVALGPAGGDYSSDEGRTWQPISSEGFDTFSFVPGRRLGWGAGARGKIGRLAFD